VVILKVSVALPLLVRVLVKLTMRRVRRPGHGLTVSVTPAPCRTVNGTVFEDPETVVPAPLL